MKPWLDFLALYLATFLGVAASLGLGLASSPFTGVRGMQLAFALVISILVVSRSDVGDLAGKLKPQVVIRRYLAAFTGGFTWQALTAELLKVAA